MEKEEAYRVTEGYTGGPEFGGILFNPVQVAPMMILICQIKEGLLTSSRLQLKPRLHLPSRHSSPACLLPEDRALETEGLGARPAQEPGGFSGTPRCWKADSFQLCHAANLSEQTQDSGESLDSNSGFGSASLSPGLGLRTN